MNRIGFLILFTVLVVCNASAQTAKQLQKVSITVSSLEKLVPFYEKVLSFKKVAEYEWTGKPLQHLTGLKEPDLKARIALMQLGLEQIELIEFIDETRQLALPADSRSNDLWFQHIAIVVRDMEDAYAHLRTHKVQFVSTAPQTLPEYLPAAAGISAFYFRDPDGHNLEVIHFPKGKGNPKWQAPTDQLFLGIDHTAIGIEDTDIALGFYEDLLGLKIAGTSENYGTEQEHLNQVFGAHLMITGLVAKQGIGLEFLDYLAPPGGRTYPLDSRPTDLWHWHTTIAVNDLNKVYQLLQANNHSFISNGIVQLNGQRGFLLRDPDGHALYIIGD
jgi:catechol 2,3-dioxygenase-like lactoylglutathione lyase family enzyme